MVPSPTLRLRRLSSSLRTMRGACGMTIDEVGAAIGMSKSAVSRIENGLVIPKLPVLNALLATFGASEEQAVILRQLAREAAQKGWWQSGPTFLRDATKTLVGLEAEASSIDDFAPTLVPGLLQTRAYAEDTSRALMPDATPEQVTAAVEFRMRRQERLGEFRFWGILAEEVLVRPVGGARVMGEQIQHLSAVAERPRVTIQVLPLECGSHPGMAGAFTLIGFGSSYQEVTYVEGTEWDACIEESDAVEVYRRSFERLRSLALSPPDSLRTLARLREELA